MVVVVVLVGRRVQLHLPVLVVVQLAVVVAALGRRAEVGAAAAQVGAVGAGAGVVLVLLLLEERLLEVHVGLHVARVWRVRVRGPQLLVAARVGRRRRRGRGVGVAEPGRGGRAGGRRAARRRRTALRLRLSFCARHDIHDRYYTIYIAYLPTY